MKYNNKETIDKMFKDWVLPHFEKELENKPHKPLYQPMFVMRSKWNPFYWIKGEHKIVWATKPEQLLKELSTDNIEIKR